MYVPKLRGKVDFSGYGPDFGVLTQPIANEFNELLEAIFSNEDGGGLQVSLSGSYDDGEDGYGHVSLDDPLTVYVELPFSGDQLGFNALIHAFQIGELIDDEFFHDEWSANGAARLARITDALRWLADSVDKKGAVWAEKGEWPDEP